MIGSEANEKPNAVSEADDAAKASAVPRRPYHAPKLRCLGSVRELTLGGTTGMSEGGGTFRVVM